MGHSTVDATSRADEECSDNVLLEIMHRNGSLICIIVYLYLSVAI